MIAVCLLSISRLTFQSDTVTAVDSSPPKIFRIKPAFNLDIRDSFLESQHVNIWQINTGIEFVPRHHQLTVGYYWIN